MAAAAVPIAISAASAVVPIILQQLQKAIPPELFKKMGQKLTDLVFEEIKKLSEEKIKQLTSSYYEKAKFAFSLAPKLMKQFLGGKGGGAECWVLHGARPDSRWRRHEAFLRNRAARHYHKGSCPPIYSKSSQIRHRYRY
jgi:hypothetical protein